MALKITNIIGPMQQTEHLFDTENLIEIGRDPSCQVRYPADFDSIGRKHLSIVEDVGRYEIRTNTKNPVYLDGVLAEDDMELPDSCVISLGVKDGPSFKVERVVADAMPQTKDYGAQTEIHTKVKKGGVWVKVALFLIIVGGGGFGYQEWKTQQQIKAINEQAGAAFKKIYKTIDADIGQLASKLSSSVYLVILKGENGETPMGTAWVASDNSLATNSHVAQIFHDIAKFPEYQFIVRSIVKPYKDHIITSVAMHPAYNAFAEAWKKADPKLIAANNNIESVKFIPGYDVALLYPESAEGLAKPMKLASMNTLTNLTSGMEVAYIGFPMEGVQKQVFATPTPTIQVANITSITDFFRGQAPFSAAQMIQHSLPAIGGASGSPIINNKGEVIALLNAGTVASVNDKGERIPNAVQINYAQRVDLLAPLLEHGDNFSIDDLISKWQEGFDRYSNEQKVAQIVVKGISKQILKGWKESLKVKKEVEIYNQEITIKADHRIDDTPYSLVQFTAPKDGNYLVMAIDSEKNDIDLVVADFTSGSFKELSRHTKDDFYPRLNIKVRKGSKIGVYVLHKKLKDSDKASSKAQLFIYSD